MTIENLDARAKATAEKRIVRVSGASSTESHEITVEQGNEKQINRLPKGQIDSTVACSQFKEPEREKGYKPADIKNLDPAEPSPDEIITIGDTVIRPNPIANTWEGTLTPGGNAAHEVLVNGVRVVGDGAVSAVYAALLAQKNAQKNSKKGAK